MSKEKQYTGLFHHEFNKKVDKMKGKKWFDLMICVSCRFANVTISVKSPIIAHWNW